MTRQTNDPLLTAANVLLVVFEVILIFSMVMVAIGLGAVLTVQRGEIVAEIAAEGRAAWTYWGVVAGIAATIGVLYLSLRFTRELKKIVASVKSGDPFIEDNAARLARMGWLALAIQGITLLIGFAAAGMGALTEGFSVDGDGDVSISGEGIVLVLTLFILARIFRMGTTMREELQGTV
ncbi:MAG: DUF2975 domain-containing protein [Planctomycetota bacterium]